MHQWLIIKSCMSCSFHYEKDKSQFNFQKNKIISHFHIWWIELGIACWLNKRTVAFKLSTDKARHLISTFKVVPPSPLFTRAPIILFLSSPPPPLHFRPHSPVLMLPVLINPKVMQHGLWDAGHHWVVWFPLSVHHWLSRLLHLVKIRHSKKLHLFSTLGKVPLLKEIFFSKLFEIKCY